VTPSRLPPAPLANRVKERAPGERQRQILVAVLDCVEEHGAGGAGGVFGRYEKTITKETLLCSVPPRACVVTLQWINKNEILSNRLRVGKCLTEPFWIQGFGAQGKHDRRRIVHAAIHLRPEKWGMLILCV
jgi:hypothetical protein